MVYELACGLVATTVVDSVALKSSALNSFQYSEVFLTLNLKDLRREFRLAHTWSRTRISALLKSTEICGIDWIDCKAFAALVCVLLNRVDSESISSYKIAYSPINEDPVRRKREQSDVRLRRPPSPAGHRKQAGMRSQVASSHQV